MLPDIPCPTCHGLRWIWDHDHEQGSFKDPCPECGPLNAPDMKPRRTRLGVPLMTGDDIGITFISNPKRESES
jgi:hypothetical protein